MATRKKKPDDRSKKPDAQAKGTRPFPEEKNPEIRELATRLFFDFGVLGRGPMKKIEGATRGEMAMLGAIYSKKGEVSPTDLAEMVGVSSARVANTLKTLEKKGFVTRELDRADRRRIVVMITPAGSDFFVTNHREAVDGLCQLIHDLGEDDAREFVRISDKIISLMSDADGVKVPEFPGVV